MDLPAILKVAACTRKGILAQSVLKDIPNVTTVYVSEVQGSSSMKYNCVFYCILHLVITHFWFLTCSFASYCIVSAAEAHIYVI